ncbi:MAG: ADP-ribosylglycohydrolase family protein, partial [Chthonomonadales bacterium]
DLNYTTTGLVVYREFGPSFTPDNVIDFWAENIPLLNTFTAERAALRNHKNGLKPTETATVANPYREWIGAQIRADFWGYVAAGNPELAADFAFRDASVSHVKNGIYGEMWAAGMVAAAFVTSDPREIILAGMDQIPEKSRLYDYLESILEWHEIEVDYDTCVRRVHEMWDEKRDHHWCHTIPNAMIVALGLLFGEGDFGKSICRAVQPCFDTDCNGATVGSIFGAAHGHANLPTKWISPLKDMLHTGVAGYEDVTFTDMAQLTLELYKRDQ